MSAVSDADYAALAEFRYAVARFLRFSEQAARAVGLQARQHQALLMIKGASTRQGITIKQLAERLQVGHNSAVGLVDRLAKGDLVRRVHDETDRRLVHVQLTAQGDLLIARLSATHKAELHRTGPTLRRRLSQVLGIDEG